MLHESVQYSDENSSNPSTQSTLGSSTAAMSSSNPAKGSDTLVASRQPLLERLDVVVAAIGWLLLVAFTAYTIGPGLVGDKVFLGTDSLSQWSPWKETSTTTTVLNRGLGDTFDSVAPTSILIVDSGNTGSFAQWDPYNSGGTQAASLPNSAILSPLSLPWWILDHARAPAGVKLMEILAASLGMWLLLRKQWTLPRASVPLASMIFVSSGFMIAWTNWPQTRVAALIPLLFWSVDRLAVGRSWWNSVAFGFILASMLLGGFPAVTAYAMYTAVAYFFMRSTASGRSIRHASLALLQSAAGAVLALALSAIQLLPFAWFATHFVDFESRSGSAGWHMPSSTLATTIVPYILGFPNLDHDSWPIHFVEGFSYLGGATFILALVAIMVSRRLSAPPRILWFFVLAYLVWTVASYYGGPILSAIQTLPGLSSSLIGRARSIIGFLAAVLAALGLSALYERASCIREVSLERSSPARRTLSLVIRLVLAAALLLPVILSIREALPESDLLFAQKWVLATLVIVTAVSVASLMLAVKASYSGWALTATIALVLTAVPAASVAHHWWPLSDKDSFYPETATHAYLHAELGEYRFAGIGAMQPSTSSAYQLRSLTGHAFTTPQWKSLLQALDPDVYRTPTYTDLSASAAFDTERSSVLDRLGVRFLVLAPNQVLPGEAESHDIAVAQTDLTAGNSLNSSTYKGPIRGVHLKVLSQNGITSSPGMLRVALVASDGTQLAQTTSKVFGIAGDEFVAIQEESIDPDTEWHAELTFEDSNATITVATTSQDRVVTTVVRPTDDDLTVVHTGDATIVRRESALTRIRWASTATVIADEQTRLSAMLDPNTSSSTVILEHVADVPASTDTESTALVTSTDVDTNTMSISVNSTGAGWLVISDQLRGGGWSATLDGSPVDLVEAEQVGAAVWIDSAGQHTISVSYSAPYFRIGTWISCATVLIILGLAGAVAVRSTRRKMETARSGRDAILGNAGSDTRTQTPSDVSAK